jgi:hypothetical protein
LHPAKPLALRKLKKLRACDENDVVSASDLLKHRLDRLPQDTLDAVALDRAPNPP